MVSLLDAFYGEKIISYYMQAIDAYNNIKIQHDRTGQCNKLIVKFCETLYEMNDDFKMIFLDIYQDWYELSKDQYNLINHKFKYTLYDVYEKLKILDDNKLIISKK